MVSPMNTNTMTLPIMFREALASAGLRVIDQWWAHLDASSRSEALQSQRECLCSVIDTRICRMT